jgi:phosphopentomutase
LTVQAVKSELDLDKIMIMDCGNKPIDFIFTNLVDTDMLYGHRNDAADTEKQLKKLIHT